METNNKTLADRFILGLKTAATEVEEMQLQIALGKAEAKDIFEELKKKFSGRLTELKNEYTHIKNNKNILPVLNALENLQVQLALGISETSEVFEDQIKKIRNELKALETELKHSDFWHVQDAEMHLELEKFKAKLELLILHFKLKKVKTEYLFQQKKGEFQHKMDELSLKVMEREAHAKEKWKYFKTELEEAFTHLKRAFVN